MNGIIVIFRLRLDMKRQPETRGWRFAALFVYAIVDAGNALYSVFRLPLVLRNIMGNAPNSVFRLPTPFTQRHGQPENSIAHHSLTRWLKMLRLPFSNCNEAVSPKRNAKPIAKMSITASCNERDTIGE